MAESLSSFSSGLFGGVAGIIVGHPLDTVKIRLQTQSDVYSGMIDCCKKTWNREGGKGFFKGMSSPLYGVSIINCVVFGAQSNMMKLFPDDSVRSNFLSGAGAGAFQAAFASPMELAKTQMQVQGISKTNGCETKYKSSRAAIANIFKHRGMFGVCRGFHLTLLRDAPAFGIYFATYTQLTHTIFPVKDEGQLNTREFVCAFMAGGIAGVASWAFTYPIDVLKSCLQADFKYKGALDCARQLYKAGRLKPFYRGIGATLIRAFPVNAATFVGVQVFDRFQEDLRHKWL